MLEIGILILIVLFLFYIFRILMIALDRSLVWFLACLFIPVCIYVYSFMYWEDIEKPFIKAHAAFIGMLILLGIYISRQDPSTIPHATRPPGM